ASSFEPMRRARALARTRHHPRMARAIEGAAAALVLLRRRPAAVWANTVMSGSWVGPALRLRVPVVLHVHELEPLTSAILGRYGLDGRWGRVRLVACSDAARRDLAEATSVPLDDIGLLPSLVDQHEIAARAGSKPRRVPVDGRLVVGACGSADPRKGFDLFLELAGRFADGSGEPAVFRWVGAADDSARAQAAGVPGVELVGEVADAVPELAAMDVVVVPSRADAFPLVVLEAMTLARPIVAFAVGGIPEQLGESGILVPPEDVDAMARAVSGLLADADNRHRRGEQAEARAHERFGFDRFEDAVAEIIDAVIDAPGRRG
ncbi:MAG: glycosyltransferase family 4 protein, partial [Actinomycetota bacterium]|nr:glycosyltransferase family 4 protein [Actinomycetota bacterium]